MAKRLVILDSHAILHRAYHALPDFSSARGEPTGALYGLSTMLLKTADELKPDYIIAARDLPEPTHRHVLFEDYKGKREKTEDALVVQLEKAPEIFKAFGIPVVSAPGYEADDCIGALVKKAKKVKGLEIIIASGDMDTLQLVDGQRVRVYTLRKGLSDTVIYDEEAVKERYGFGPELLPDYKGLRGDPSDNIPGIRGIGEKTGSELIATFGSIEDIYKTLKKNPKAFTDAGIKPRIVKLLEEGEEAARFSKNLAIINQDIPTECELPTSEWHLAEHLDSILSMCDEFDFRSLKERLLASAKKKGAAPTMAMSMSDTKRVAPDARRVMEASIGVWLLRSDTTAPDLDDVLRFAKTDDFEKAYESVLKELRATGRLYDVFEKIEKPLIPVAEKMHKDGIAVDVAYLKALSKEYAHELAKIEKRIYKHAGREFNISSPKQLGEVLFDELKLSLPRQKKTATGARTTKEDELQKMSDQHPIIEDVLLFRELSKLLSTYVEKMPDLVGPDGRLHATFLQAGTTTGRMASIDPNLQNIPIRTEYGKRIREAFVAERGSVLVALDYSQIELRVAAGLSGDKKLVGVFKENGDIHAAVAAEVFGVPPEMVDREMRRRAKIINFGILYGMGVNALRESLGANVTRDEAAKFLDDYFENFGELARWIKNQKASAARLGYTETLFGRRRYFAGFKSPLPYVRAQAERMAVNAPIQGTQADVIKLAMVEANRLIEREGLRDTARLVLQIHDELVYEIPEKDAERIGKLIKKVMEDAVPSEKLSGVPIVAELAIGRSWGALKKLSV